MSSIKDLNALSQQELALLWGVSTRTIQRLPDADTLRHGAGQGCYYVWGECWNRNPRLLGATVAGDDGSDKARKLRAEADIAEMEAREMAGNLLDRKAAIQGWSSLLGRLKDNLMGYPGRVADRISPEMELAEREDVLKKEIHAVLRDVVALIEKDAEVVE